MKRRNLTAITCVLFVAAAAVTGCGSNAAGQKQAAVNKDGTPDISQKVDLVIGGLDRGNSSDDKYWPETVVSQMEKKLNVNLKMVNYDQQKLGLDMASGDLPDVMLVYRDNSDSVIKGRHAIPLNKYFDTIGKDLNLDRYSFRNEVMAKYQSGGDGNVYFTTPAVTVKGDSTTDSSTGGGFGVRWDLYKQIGAPPINTLDDYAADLKKMHELCPKTPEGLPTYGLGVYNDVGLSAWTYLGILNSNYISLDGDTMYIFDKGTHQVSSNVATDDPNTPFWSDMHFYNKLWKEGVLDPDCFITKGEDLIAKFTKGQYLGAVNNWYCGDYNQNVKKESGSTAGIVILPAYDINQGGYFPAGWNDKLIFVSSHSKHVDRAVMFLDYINSEEFARLQYSGVKGVNWKVGTDGKPALTQETINMQNDPAQTDAWGKLGLSGWINWGGLNAKAMLADGAPASLWNDPNVLSQNLSATDADMCKTLGLQYPAQYGQKLVQEGTHIDNNSYDSRFQAVMPSPPQDITRIGGNVAEIVTNALPSLVQAQDDAAFEAARKKLISDVTAAGSDQELKWWQDNVKEALDYVASLDQS